MQRGRPAGPAIRSSLPQALLAAVAVAAIAWIGGIALAHPERCVTTDGIEYLGLARNLQEGAGFVSPDTGLPELHRTPGYPVFLLPFRTWRGVAELRETLVAQAVLLLLTCGLLVRTVRRHSAEPSRSAWWAALLLLVNPVVLLSIFQILSETLFVFLVMGSAWLTISAERGRGWPSLLAAGLALGAAVLVRPVGLVLLPVNLLYLLFLRRRGGRSFRRGGVPARGAGRDGSAPGGTSPGGTLHGGKLPAGIGRGAILLWLLGACALPAAWTAHNGFAHGYWGLSKSGVSFLSAAYGEAYLGENRALTRGTDYDTGGSAAQALREVITSVGRNPGAAVRSWISGLAQTLAGPAEWSLRRTLLDDRGGMTFGGPVASYRMEQTEQGLEFVTEDVMPRGEKPASNRRSAVVWMLLAWSLGASLLTYGLALRGTVTAFVRRDPSMLLWLFSAAVLVISTAGYASTARFRVPALPFLALLAVARPAVGRERDGGKRGKGHEPKSPVKGTGGNVKGPAPDSVEPRRPV